MKTTSFHHTNMGAYAPTAYADNEGYITRHVSDRYAKADEAKLNEWLDSRIRYVRAAAAVELASRALAKWQAE